jgi:Fe-S cluster biogenesis protein NfuA
MDDQELSARLDRIENLLDKAGNDAVELVGELLDLYGEGLSRMVALAGPADLASDDLVSYLLLLHGLHPRDARERVADAVRSHGGAELLSVEGDLARLRLRAGSCGCGSSARTALEELVRDVAPEIERVEIEDAVRPPVMIPVESLRVESARSRSGGRAT